MQTSFNQLFNDKWSLVMFVTFFSAIFTYFVYKIRWDSPIFSIEKIGTVPDYKSHIRKVWIGVIIYTVFFTVVSILQHYAINTLSHDLGLFDQLIWNVLHGKIGHTTLSASSVFKEHLMLIIIPLSSFFLIFDGPEILLFLQSLFFALPAVFLYLIATKKLNSPFAGLAFSISYLFCPFIHNANLWNFTPFVFIIFFVIFGLYLIMKKKLIWGIICFVIAFSCREDVALYTLPLSILIFFREKDRRAGATLFAVSFLWFMIVSKIIMPSFNPPGSRYNIMAEKYGWLGGSITAIILSFITNPFAIIKHIFTLNNVQIMLRLLLPVAFLNVGSIWGVLLIILPLFSNLLSTMEIQSTMQFQYPIHIIPFVYIGAIYGAETIINKCRSKENKLNLIWVFILISSILSSFTFGSTIYNFRRCKTNEHKKMFFSLVKQNIPKTSFLSAQANLLPHFSHRDIIYRFPQVDNAEYVLIDVNSNKWPCSDEEYEKNVVLLRANPKYELIFENDGYMVFKRIKG